MTLRIVLSLFIVSTPLTAAQAAGSVDVVPLRSCVLEIDSIDVAGREYGPFVICF